MNGWLGTPKLSYPPGLGNPRYAIAAGVTILQLDSFNWYLYSLWVLYSSILYFMHFAKLMMPSGRQNLYSVTS